MGALTFSAPRILRTDDDVTGFECGIALVDEWVSSRAHQARRAGTAVVYASFCDGILAGFYTLSAQSVTRSDTSGWIARNAPEQIPVILLGMLGVNQRFQSQGLGRDLLLDAVHRAGVVSEQLGARALVIDPVNESARAFYERYGFLPMPGTHRMFSKL